MKTKAILIDIDNTLVDANSVFANVAGKYQKEQFLYFYDHVMDCPPIQWCIDLVQDMASKYHIVFLTGRGRECREATKEQLKQLGFSNFTLVMRPKANFEPDDNMKRKALNILVNEYDFAFAIDDRESNCKVYTEEFNIPSLVVYYPKNERLD